MNSKLKSQIIIFGSILIAIFESISFIFAAIANDVKTYYMGLAYSAKYCAQGEFIGVLKNWELKGFLSRYILWFPHKFASIFFDYQTLDYFRAYKTWYVIILLLVVLYIVFAYKKKTNDVEKAALLGIMTLSLFMMTHSTFHMQAEMSVAIMLILAIAVFSFYESIIAAIIAGIITGLTFFVKDSFIIMDIAVLGAVLFLSQDIRNELKKLFTAILSTVLTIVIILVLLYLFYPQEIIDALAVPKMYRTVLAGNPLPIYSFIQRFFIEACYGAPCIFIGMVASIIAFVRKIRNKNILAAVGLVFMWLAPTITILLSGRTNVYYYNLYLVSSFVVLYQTLNDINIDDILYSKANIIVILIAFLMCLIVNTEWFYRAFHERHLLFFCIPIIFDLIAFFIAIINKDNVMKTYGRIVWISLFAIYIASISCISLSYHNLKNVEKINYENAHEITEEFTKSAEKIGPILYLDDGLGLALLGCESFSRYFFPIPIQRVDLESDSYTGEFKEELYKALDYTGKYILINENWFYNFYENKLIKRKLENEYELERLYQKYVYTSGTFCLKDGYIQVEYKLLKRK